MQSCPPRHQLESLIIEELIRAVSNSRETEPCQERKMCACGISVQYLQEEDLYRYDRMKRRLPPRYALLVASPFDGSRAELARSILLEVPVD